MRGLIRDLVLAVGLILGAGLLHAADAHAEATVNDEGLHVQPWFHLSFLDLRDDLREAAEAGKRFAVVWEQRGCIYCRDMHVVNFAIPAVSDYVRENFVVVQLNLFGARKVTDFDGEVLAEKDLARKWGVVFTPTILYFPDALDDDVRKSGKEIAVAQMPGYFRPVTFLAMFRYVREKRYGEVHFQKYLADVSDEIRRLDGMAARQ